MSSFFSPLRYSIILLNPSFPVAPFPISTYHHCFLLTHYHSLWPPVFYSFSFCIFIGFSCIHSSFLLLNLWPEASLLVLSQPALSQLVFHSTWKDRNISKLVCYLLLYTLHTAACLLSIVTFFDTSEPAASHSLRWYIHTLSVSQSLVW